MSDEGSKNHVDMQEYVRVLTSDLIHNAGLRTWCHYGRARSCPVPASKDLGPHITLAPFLYAFESLDPEKDAISWSRQYSTAGRRTADNAPRTGKWGSGRMKVQIRTCTFGVQRLNKDGRLLIQRAR